MDNKTNTNIAEEQLITAAAEETSPTYTVKIQTRTDYIHGDVADDPRYAYVNNNFPHTFYDARGNTVTHTMNLDDLTLASVTDPKGQTVEYGYDASKRVNSVSTTTEKGTSRNQYTYEYDRLKSVCHNTDSNAANNVVYTFGYDGLGRKETVKVGNRTLSTNVYSNDRRGLLTEVRYGSNKDETLPEGITRNGGKVIYDHDDFGRLMGIKYDNDPVNRFSYEYGANGQAALMKDRNLKRIHRTEYDLAERPCQSTIREMDDSGSEGDLIYRTTLLYDGKNRLQDFMESLPGESHKTTYSYDRDNRATAIQYDDENHKVAYTYDGLGRLAERIVTNRLAAEEDTTSGVYFTRYGYLDWKEETDENGNVTLYTTPLVESITQGDGNNRMDFAYTYDECGNITSESRNGQVTTYSYDALGQLVSVNDPHENAIWEYTYDLGGNIKEKQKFARNADGSKGLGESPITYTYGDPNWKDKLTAYDGVAISYDDIGNPTYDGTWTYIWQAGRQLKEMSKPGMLVEFKYNAEGLRVQKKVTEGNPDAADTIVTTTDYTLHDKLITHQKVTKQVGETIVSTDEMHFFYDSASRPALVKYNGELYAYVHNLQGDIVGITDTDGNLVVEYKYDAWGKPLTEHTGLGKLNPFRYRTYAFDVEIGLYYLHSRYYNSSINRFSCCDLMIDTDSALLVHNGYAYCINNPILFCDSDGLWLSIIIGGIIGAVSSASIAYAFGARGKELCAAAISGAVGGCIGGISGIIADKLPKITVAASVLFGAVGNIAGEITSQVYISGEITDPASIVINAGIGVGFGWLSGNINHAARTALDAAEYNLKGTYNAMAALLTPKEVDRLAILGRTISTNVARQKMAMTTNGYFLDAGINILTPPIANAANSSLDAIMNMWDYISSEYSSLEKRVDWKIRQALR